MSEERHIVSILDNSLQRLMERNDPVADLFYRVNQHVRMTLESLGKGSAPKYLLQDICYSPADFTLGWGLFRSPIFVSRRDSYRRIMVNTYFIPCISLLQGRPVAYFTWGHGSAEEMSKISGDAALISEGTELLPYNIIQQSTPHMPRRFDSSVPGSLISFREEIESGNMFLHTNLPLDVPILGGTSLIPYISKREVFGFISIAFSLAFPARNLRPCRDLERGYELKKAFRPKNSEEFSSLCVYMLNINLDRSPQRPSAYFSPSNWLITKTNKERLLAERRIFVSGLMSFYDPVRRRIIHSQVIDPLTGRDILTKFLLAVLVRSLAHRGGHEWKGFILVRWNEIKSMYDELKHKLANLTDPEEMPDFEELILLADPPYFGVTRSGELGLLTPPIYNRMRILGRSFLGTRDLEKEMLYSVFKLAIRSGSYKEYLDNITKLFNEYLAGEKEYHMITDIVRLFSLRESFDRLLTYSRLWLYLQTLIGVRELKIA